MMTSDKAQTLKKLAIRVDALRRAMETVMAGTTPDHGKWGAFKNYAHAYNILAGEYVRATGTREVPTYNLEKMKGSMDTVWPVQKEIFDTIFANTLALSGLLMKYDVGISASISEIQDLLVANLRKAMFKKPESETEVQNAIEALLIGRGYQRPLDYDRETGRVKYSGKEFVPDFIFKRYDLVLEVKLIKTRQQVFSCVEEMCADVPAYTSVYQNLLFCVYDLGEIRDVNEFQEGLQSEEGVRVCVIKH
jgi:hypothetical protein